MSSIIYRKYLPLIITTVTALLVMGGYFLTPPEIVRLTGVAQNWAVSITTFAIIPGAISIIIWQYRSYRTAKKRIDKIFPLNVYLFLLIFFGVAMLLGVASRTYTSMAQSIIASASTGIGISNGFWVFLCAIRAFRIRTFTGALLMSAAFITMLGIAPWGFLTLGPWTTTMSTWLLAYIDSPMTKGIIMGGSVGIAIAGIRTLTGTEVAYMRGE